MPTVFSHPAVPLAIGLAAGCGVISRRLLIAGVLCSIAPDLDVYFGATVEEGSPLAHRSMTHSLVFAALCGLIAACAARWLHARAGVAFLFITVATGSHGLLDALTNGGMGIQLLWPFSDARYFFPVQPLEVSPVGLRSFFSFRMIEVLISEVKWVWIPAIALGALLYRLRTR